MARQNSPVSLFAYEARKEGRTVALLRGIAGVNGAVTVETEIYPVTAAATADPQVRPYAFPSREQATRFVDEALLALEYLGCTLAE
jgi:hypothetical protein